MRLHLFFVFKKQKGGINYILLKKICKILNDAVKKYGKNIIGSYAYKLLLKYVKNIIKVPYLE